MVVLVSQCIHGFYSTMQDKSYTYNMHAVHYSYGMMQCINSISAEDN